MPNPSCALKRPGPWHVAHNLLLALWFYRYGHDPMSLWTEWANRSLLTLTKYSNGLKALVSRKTMRDNAGQS